MVTESRHTETAKVEPADTTRLIAIGLSFLLVVALALLANRLTQMSKAWLGRDLLEYPLWAVMLGLIGAYALATVANTVFALGTVLSG